MSAAATAWAWEQDPAASVKFLLLALADLARPDGVIVSGPAAQVELAKMTGAKERTVRANLVKLEQEELLRRFPTFEDGYRVPDLMKLPVDGKLDLPADIASGRNGRAVRSSTATSQGTITDENTREPELAFIVSGAGVSEEMVADAEELLRTKRKVGGRVVTVREMGVAACALAEFNRQASSDYGLGAHLTPIVMRLRERPSWDGAKLVRLVASAWRVRWWEQNGRSGRRATPAVIFGNERVFEAVVQDAAAEARGEPTEKVQERRFKRTAPVEMQGDPR